MNRASWRVAKIIASNFSASNFRGPLATSVDIDTAIEQAAARHNPWSPNLVRAVVKVESNSRSQRGVAEGRDGADAVDACDGAAVESEESI